MRLRFLMFRSKLNGTWACENDKALNGWLKQEMGFQGYIVSDWNVSDVVRAVFAIRADSP